MRKPSQSQGQRQQADANTVRTRTADLRKVDGETPTYQRWSQAVIASDTLFIVEGTEGPSGGGQPRIKVAANLLDALAARASLGRWAGDMFLFAIRRSISKEQPIYGKIREAFMRAPREIIVTLESGEIYLIASSIQSVEEGREHQTSCLYSFEVHTEALRR